jgi:Papain family cysteine protease
MKLFLFITLWTSLVPSFGAAHTRQHKQRTMQDALCEWEMVSFCAQEANRYCFLDSASKPVCGNCLEGYVEWRARCIRDEAVDLALFLDEYRPKYISTLSTEERTQLLIAAIQFIASYQNQNPPPAFQLGLNIFSADFLDDSRALRGFNASATAATSETAPVFKSAAIEPQGLLPTSVDWVEQGAVTSVKDQVRGTSGGGLALYMFLLTSLILIGTVPQGRCGCCWANSVAGVIEGATAIQNDYLQSLSWQQFVSCDDTNYGCDVRTKMIECFVNTEPIHVLILSVSCALGRFVGIRLRICIKVNSRYC